MIARISGTVTEQGANHLLLEAGGITYEVLIPTAVMQRIPALIAADGRINLVTFHYHQVEPSRSFPILVGFLNEVEREFFETFITVSGIGPRAALKALNKPISEIARAIDEGDIAFLRSLPGIGPQRAREVVAKLQHKIAKFALLQDTGGTRTPAPVVSDIGEEAVAVLVQLEYKKPEAAAMVQKALERNPAVKNTEELLNEVYKYRKHPAAE